MNCPEIAPCDPYWLYNKQGERRPPPAKGGLVGIDLSDKFAGLFGSQLYCDYTPVSCADGNPPTGTPSDPHSALRR
jgi:hypothetical protein